MFEKKYRVLDETGKEIATGMTLGMAVIFIKGYAYELFNDHLCLTIDELEPVVGERPNNVEPGTKCPTGRVLDPEFECV